MEDIDLSTEQTPQITAARVADWPRRERTPDGLPCQVHVPLEGDMSDGGKRTPMLTINPGFMREHGLDEVPCTACDGTGTLDDKPCPTCNGTGKVKDPSRAFKERVWDKIDDPPQALKDQIGAWLKTNVPKPALMALFR